VSQQPIWVTFDIRPKFLEPEKRERSFVSTSETW
jgi:hypothetical protein